MTIAQKHDILLIMTENNSKYGPYYDKLKRGLCPNCSHPTSEGDKKCSYCHIAFSYREILVYHAFRHKQHSDMVLLNAKIIGQIRKRQLKQLFIFNLKERNRYKYKGEGGSKKHPMNQNVCIKILKATSYRLYKTNTKWLDLYEILEKQNFKCPLSGYLLKLGDNASLDHILPRSRGGSNTITNLQWVDKEVNVMKWNHTPDEFLLWIKRLYNHISS